MAHSDVKTRRWKRVEYDRLIESGFFQPGDPVELVGGQLIVAEPQGSYHFASIRAAQEALRRAFGSGWDVRGQGASIPRDRLWSSRSASRASCWTASTKAVSTPVLGPQASVSPLALPSASIRIADLLP
jgi:hypothetical protein